ncbi:predicted protein, partial [Brucella melitensis bv. 1 str. 16M]
MDNDRKQTGTEQSFMAIAPKAGFARTLFATVALGAMSVAGTVSMGTPPALAAQGP